MGRSIRFWVYPMEKCYLSEPKTAGNEYRRNCCWRKMLSWEAEIWESGNLRCSVRCRVALWCDMLYFFPFRHPEQGRRISRRQSVATKILRATCKENKALVCDSRKELLSLWSVTLTTSATRVRRSGHKTSTNNTENKEQIHITNWALALILYSVNDQIL